MVTTACRHTNLLRCGQVFDRAEGIDFQRLAGSNDFFSLLLLRNLLAGVVMRSPDMTGGRWRQLVDLILFAKTRVENTTCPTSTRLRRSTRMRSSASHLHLPALLPAPPRPILTVTLP